MATQPNPCLDETTVLGLLDGTLLEARAVEVEAHLAACSACRELVSVLAGSSLARAVGEDAAAPTGYVEGLVIGGRFRLLRALGEGGMGCVWAAEHLVTRREVALKLAKGLVSERERQRFLREARVAAALEHPGIVPVRDAFELDDGTPVLVMDLLRGRSLREHLVEHAPLSADALRALIVPLLDALAAAHARGVVHRDLKPENVFLVEDPAGNAPIVRVLDFGIAKLVTGEELGSEMTRTGELLGTPFYMAPEQAFGERVDPRADLWALGVICYEALTGERPFSGENLGQLLKSVTTGAHRPLGERRPELPSRLVSLVESLLVVDRERRPDGAAVQAAFAQLDAPSPRPRLLQGRGRLVAAITLAAALAAAGLAWRASHHAPPVRAEPVPAPPPAMPVHVEPVAPPPAAPTPVAPRSERPRRVEERAPVAKPVHERLPGGVVGEVPY